jgi:hypothetical protein
MSHISYKRLCVVFVSLMVSARLEADTLAEEDPLFDTTDWPSWAGTAWESTSDVLHDHLRVGVRYRSVELTDDKRSSENSYLGSITQIENLDDYDWTTWLTVEWLANPYIGLRFNYEQVRGRTRTSSWDNHTDGDIDVMGPQFSLIVRLPNRTRFTPTAGVGYAWLNSTFEHNPVWYNGFGGEDKIVNYNNWVQAGRPPWPNNGYRREIILEDTSAVILLAGLEIRITDHLDFNLFAQDMAVEDIDLRYELSFGGNVTRREYSRFPMANTSYGAGVRWTF